MYQKEAIALYNSVKELGGMYLEKGAKVYRAGEGATVCTIIWLVELPPVSEDGEPMVWALSVSDDGCVGQQSELPELVYWDVKKGEKNVLLSLPHN